MTTLATVLSLIAAAAAAAAGIGYLAKAGRRGARRFLAVVDVILGTDDQPGLGDRLKPLEQLHERLQRLEHEMHPNSGKSLRDAINRIERDLGGLKRTVQRNAAAGRKGRLQDHEVAERLTARIDELKNQLDQEQGGTS